MPLPCDETKVACGRCLCVGLLACLPAAGQTGDLDTMGVTLLRASQPGLMGTGIDVAQPEALNSDSSPEFEVNYTVVDQPEDLFAWISTNGTATNYPNDLGTESSHADQVGNRFYGPSQGVAPGVAHVDNYEADYFFAYIIEDGVPISDQVINQSFAFFVDTSDQEEVDSIYDDYIADNANIFSSAVNGLGSGVGAPGTAYDCIGVGAYGVGADVCDGPTLDNGRSKPDIVAPGVETSFTIPYVSGAAAVLLQAAAAGDGGTNTTDAGNVMTIKALLLNGAIKPFDWTHTTNMPLDTRYGAGVLNLYYSYGQLAGGEQGYTSQNNVPSGGAHPPVSSGPAVGSPAGWDYESISSNPLQDTVNHYLFNVASNATLTATLVWERHAEMTNISNLALFLYNATNAALITCSVSLVDNVQHLYLPHLPPGLYDLEAITDARAIPETYALAFQFFTLSPPSLSVASTGTNAVITWPWSPTVYTLQQSSTLDSSANWTNVTATEWITNTTVLTSVNYSDNAAYFRLVR